MIIQWLFMAIRDRDSQINLIAEHNPKAAITQGDRIQKSVDQLAEYPEIGRVGRVAGTLELVISRTPFIAIYRIKNNRVQILRVLHGAQQWPQKAG